MLIVIDDPKGIDVPIRKLQEKLHSYLMNAWILDPEDDIQNALYQSYGRCYRNKKDTGYIAEVYVGSNEYKEVYWNDNLNAISFFGISSVINHNVGEIADVHMAFFVNISKLKPALTNRADEEVRMDVLNMLGKGWFGFNLVSIELGIENVLKEYPGSIRDKGLARVDMHPIHCFRINLKLNYNRNNCF